MKRIVIGFVSKSDPFHDRVAWSGTTYKVREAIELAGFEVRWIPYGASLKSKFLTLFLRTWNCTFSRNNKWLNRHHFRPIAKSWAKELDRNQDIKECDYLFFPFCCSDSSIFNDGEAIYLPF